MAHTTHPVTLHPDTRGDLSWHSLADQLDFECTDDLITFLDLDAEEIPDDCRATVPAEIESLARYALAVTRDLVKERRL